LKALKALPLFPFEDLQQLSIGIGGELANAQPSDQRPLNHPKIPEGHRSEIVNIFTLKFASYKVEGVQLSFEFYLDKTVSQFTSYIPKRKNALLDRDFSAFAARDWRLLTISCRLHDIGATRIGDVVQLSEHQVVEETGASKAIVQRLRALLQSAGLDLDMKTLGWNPNAGRGR
jgi:hypothetical protein